MLQFKEQRQCDEFVQLRTKNPRLFELMAGVQSFVHLEFNKDVILTSVYRTAEEQAELYKDVPVDKKVLNSPHMRWEAVDLRSSIYTDTEIQKLLKFLNCFSYKGGQKPVALYHMIAGNNFHFHIQFGGV